MMPITAHFACLLGCFVMAGGMAVAVAESDAPPAPHPFIAEFLAENRGGWRDEDGDTPDWIEIHHPGDTAFDLGGWFLTDSVRQLTKWRIPDGLVMEPGGYLVIFASGKDRNDPGRALHTNFKLDADGESIALVRSDGTTLASLIDRYPRQRANISFGTARQFEQAPLMASGSPARVRVPDAPSSNWQGPEFDDADWEVASIPLGFDVGGAVPADGLLGWWPFDDATIATRAVDGSGRGRDGVVARAVYSDDGLGRSGLAEDRSLIFSGTGVVSFPAAAAGEWDAIATRDAFTISLWTFGAATMPQDHYLFYGSGGSNGGGARLLDAHLPWSDSVIYFDTGGCCDPGRTRISVPESDPTKWRGQWNHYVFLKDGITKQIWQNGRLLHEGINSERQPPLRSLFLGAQNGSGTLGYRGRIDDFALWEGALTPGEIEALARGVPPPDVRRLTSHIASDLADSMHGVSSSVWVRLPFTLADADGIDLLRLAIRYDDGFVGYLNGREVVRRNAPEALPYDAMATVDRPAGAVMVAEEIDLSTFAPLLRSGLNLLAIHGLNHRAEDPEFLIGPELWAGRSLGGRYFLEPTPGAPNGEGVMGLVDEVVVVPPRGMVDAPLTVTLSCPTPGATIVATTDGSSPAPGGGTAGPSPLQVDIARTTTLRAAAFLDPLAPARPVTHTYVFVDQVATQQRPAGAPATWPGGYAGDYAMDPRVTGAPAPPGYSLRESLLSLPTMSVTTDPAGLWGPTDGIYTHPSGRGHAWERFASVEWMEPATGVAMHAWTGLRIHGNISRNKDFTPKHSFSLRFRGRHGDPRFRFPLFPGSAVASFDELVLRAGSTDTWPCTEWAPVGLGPNGELHQRWNRNWASYLRDQWVRDTQLAMGQEAFRGRYCHLYLNGCYWGLYNLTESPSASHMAAHLGGPESEWDTIADFNELRQGTRTAWDELLQLANSGQLGSDAGLRRVQGLAADGTADPARPRLLEVDNLIDYMILHVAIGADDWPNHNWWGARRSRAPMDEGFRFFAWDQEISNINVAYGRSAWGAVYAEANADGTPTRVYSRLRGSLEFRLRFADRIQRHLFGDGALSEGRAVARWKALVAEVDRAVVAESARWGDAQPNHSRPGQPYTRDHHWLPHLDWMTDHYWPHQHTTALARFRSAGLYPAVLAPRIEQRGGAGPGVVSATLINPNPAESTLIYTLTGDDPRQWGGAPHPAAATAPTAVDLTLPAGTTVLARVRQGTTWSALVEATLRPNDDLDGDGLDDAWEIAHGLSPDDPEDAALDHDGDGSDARAEFAAGTDPRDARSRMELAAVADGGEPGELILEFTVRPGRVFTLEATDSLESNASWAPVITLGPESATRIHRHPIAITPPTRFFRLRAAVAPAADSLF